MHRKRRKIDKFILEKRNYLISENNKETSRLEILFSILGQGQSFLGFSYW